MKQTIDGKLYDTEAATVVASDRRWSNHDVEREGCNTFLYKIQKGRFFVLYEAPWLRDSDRIEPLDAKTAIILFERLPKQEKTWEEVFGKGPKEA